MRSRLFLGFSLFLLPLTVLVLGAACSEAPPGLEATILTKDWLVIAAGEKLSSATESKSFDEDLASIRLTVAVHNAAEAQHTWRTDCYLADGDREILAPLHASMDEGHRFPYPDPRTMAAGATDTLHMMSVLEPRALLVARQPLFLFHKDNGWLLPLGDAPGPKEAAAEPPAVLAAEVAAVQWLGWESGTRFETGEGEAVVRSDVAGITVTLTLRNPGRKTLHLPPPLQLVGESGSTLDEFLLSHEGAAPERLPPVGLAVPAGRTLDLTVESKMLGYKELVAAGRLRLVHRALGWSLDLGAVPPRSELF